MSLLLLHAFGASAREWDAVRGRLSAAQRVDAPDLPGFGGAPDLEAPGLDAYVDWLAGRAAPDACVVAHSMSGKLALALAARRPDRVARLLLVAPSTPGAEPMPRGERGRQLQAFGDHQAARTSVEGSTRRADEAALERLAQARLATSRAAWGWWLQAGSLADIGPELARVSAPVHVVVGAQDAALGETTQRRHLLSRLSGPASLQVVAECGHFVPVEQPAALAAAIEEFGS